VREDFQELASEIESILRRSARRLGLTASISSRAKELDSFEDKASEAHPSDPAKPKYGSPLTEITDLAGVRVVTFLPMTRDEFDQLIDKELEVLERIDKGKALQDERHFGYQSIHYLVRLKPPRVDLPEYQGLGNRVCEIQLRTMVQHAWAEIEHDIRYKSKVGELPSEITRRLERVAGMLEVADREFQSISDEHTKLVEKTRLAIQASISPTTGEGTEAAVSSGPVDIAISEENVRTLVEKAIGADKRIKPNSWMWGRVASIAKRMGFTNMAELADVIKSFDWKIGNDHQWYYRPSPPSIFEEMLFQYDPDRLLEGMKWTGATYYKDKAEKVRAAKAARDAKTR
jgi:ppGpp synthetase/RelA/SpoT-type nucleotidyltranferase